jgi:hypothetical protein
MTRRALHDHCLHADAGNGKLSENLPGRFLRFKLVQQLPLLGKHPGIATRHIGAQNAAHSKEDDRKDVPHTRSAGRQLRILKVNLTPPPRWVKHQRAVSNEAARPSKSAAGPQDLHKINVVRKNLPPAILIQSTQAAEEWWKSGAIARCSWPGLRRPAPCFAHWGRDCQSPKIRLSFE